MEEKDNNSQNEPDFDYGADSFELSGNYWRNKYSSERAFWEERLEASNKEKESLKSESERLKAFLDNLSSKVQRLEQSFSEDKMLYEQRLELKIKELEKFQERSTYEEKIARLEKRNVVLRKGLLPRDDFEDTELRSPSAVIALASQKIMLDLALEKEALERKCAQLEEELAKKKSGTEAVVLELENQKRELENSLKHKDAAITDMRDKARLRLEEAEKSLAERLKAIQKNTENSIKEHSELASEFALKIQDVATDIILIAKHYADGRKTAKPFENIIADGQKISETVARFMAVSETTCLKLEMEDMENAIDDALGERLENILSKNISIEKRYAKTGIKFMIDKALMARALKNIIENAVESMDSASGEKKVLSVQTSYDGANKEYVVSVSDTGIGIPADDLGKVMKPYFSKKPGRQGLGLFYANKIIKLHNGLLFLESHKGTTVKFHFKL